MMRLLRLAMNALLIALFLVPLISSAQNPFAHRGILTNPLSGGCSAQNPCPSLTFANTNILSLIDTSLYVSEPNYTDTCLAPFNWTWAQHTDPIGTSSGTDVAKWPTMRGGTGPRTFYVNISNWIYMQYFPYMINYGNDPAGVSGIGWDLYVDGQLTGSVTMMPGYLFQYNAQMWNNLPQFRFKGVLKVTHSAGDAWDIPGHARDFALRPKIEYNNNPGSTGPVIWGQSPAELRWKAVLVGTNFTEVLGTFDAPSTPIQILRDPPGDASYGSLATNTSTCRGETISASTDVGASSFAKVRIGVAGSVGLIATVDYEIYGEVGINSSANRTRTSTGEYQTCLNIGQTITTTQTGEPDDLFFGSKVRYAYGMALIVARDSCNLPVATGELAIEPVQTINSFHYTESYIRGTVLPGLQADVASLVVGTPAWKEANNQLSVWQQTLAMNDSIKANSVLSTTRSFSSGPSQDYSMETTTSQTRSIEYKVALSAGLTSEFGASFGGSGVTAGGEITFKQEFGNTASASNSGTNTVAYHLQDMGSADNFDVEIRQDRVMGNNVYRLLPTSRTSCPYEGGYQIDQPQLWVGSMNSSQMILNEVPLGAQAIFPLYVCNNSNVERDYFLKFVSSTNTEGGILSAFGNTMNGNDNGIPVTVPANGCLNVTNLYISQPNINIVDIEDVTVYLYSLCEPAIRSNVTISAYFGVGNGNFGEYCTPSSDGWTLYGNWIDGVQIGSINNTGSGPTEPPNSNVDYTASYSTTVSRGGQQMLTITPGASTNVTCAAWIDYDHSGTFDPDEQLGQFQGFVYTPQNILFTVPQDALLGTTRMRVRGVYIFSGSDPNPMEACFPYVYSEIEDYGIFINGNAPLDCNNTPNGTALPGTPCNDGNPATGGDTWNANCTCVGQPLDCAGTPNGQALPGTACNDGNANTVGDVYGADCACLGQLLDCMGNAGGTAFPGTACNDNNADTGNDQWDANCQCIGQVLDCLGVPGGSTVVGTPCNDGNPLTTGDVYNANCTCAGQLANDCVGVPGGTAQPGTACDDGNPDTGNDVFTGSCTCIGQPLDCNGIPGGTAVPGAPCNDFNAQTFNDVINANCQCLGTYALDCAGVAGGSAQPGTPCDDGDAATFNDTWSTSCVCAGLVPDCNGTPGGNALPGTYCDDGLSTTGNDMWDANCQCAGLPLDCANEPGGSALPGTACDDGDPNTSNDVYNANCLCAGALPSDCEGVAGGPAQPGTPCDDGDAGTGNDVYDNNCQCAGTLIDCVGTVGGVILPGSTCNDGNDCTTGDVWDAACNCSGTAVTIGAVSGPGTVTGLSTNAYYINPVPGATGYSWSLPEGWSTSDNSAFVLLAQVDNTTGPVELCVTATVGGCQLTSCITVTVDINTGIATGAADADEWFTVQPNPSNGQFQLRSSTTSTTPIRFSVRNGLGQEVVAPFSVAGQRTIEMDLGGVAPGAYYVLATRDGEQQAIRIMVQR